MSLSLSWRDPLDNQRSDVYEVLWVQFKTVGLPQTKGKTKRSEANLRARDQEFGGTCKGVLHKGHCRKEKSRTTCLDSKHL